MAARSRVASSAAWESNETVPHMRPPVRSTNMLALQKPSDSSMRGRTVERNMSTCRSMSVGRPQVIRQRDSGALEWSRCMSAISHSSTVGSPPSISAARARCGASWSAAARMASWVSQELVAMHRPLLRSTTNDIPAHPSIRVRVGCTSSRM